MKKNVFGFLALIVTLWSCRGLINRHFEGNGRIVHFFTGNPIKSSIHFRGDDPTTAKNLTKIISDIDTDENGYFEFKFLTNTYPSKSYITYDNQSEYFPKEIKSKIKNEYGNIYIGNQKFICKIGLIPISGSQIFFKNPVQTFSQGVNAQTRQSLTYTKQIYEEKNHSYHIEYYTIKNNIRKDSTIILPIISADTLLATIYY